MVTRWVEDILSDIEALAVFIVAHITPWLAPLPSAYFVARSSVEHLKLPPGMAWVVAAIVELLGLTTVYTALNMHDWNQNKRKSDPPAPTIVAVILGVVYIVTTIFMTIVLESVPEWSFIAPVLFPLLAIVGGVNLALIVQHHRRQSDVRDERQARRQPVKSSGAQTVRRVDTAPVSETVNLDVINANRQTEREQRQRRLIDILREQADINKADVARQLGVSRQTLYEDLRELEQAGRIHKNGNGVQVLEG